MRGSLLVCVGLALALGATLGRGPATAAAAKPAVQRATIVIDGGYKPDTVTVKVGKPVELTFVRKEKTGCGEVVQLPSLGQKRTLKTGEKAVITFTPKKVETIAFTCGMSMYQGKVVAR